METLNEIDFKRIDNDTNGNPRYVCHFLNLITDKDIAQIKEDYAASLSINPLKLTEFKYEVAIDRAKKLGGKKYNNKKYGGGIVFQSYNIADTKKRIIELLNSK